MLRGRLNNLKSAVTGLVVAWLSATLGCAETQTVTRFITKTVTLQLRFKDSCGSGLFATTTLPAYGSRPTHRQRASDKSAIGSSCTPSGPAKILLSNRLDVLCDIIFAEVVAELPKLPLDEDFYLEVRGLHASAGGGGHLPEHRNLRLVDVGGDTPSFRSQLAGTTHG